VQFSLFSKSAKAFAPRTARRQESFAGARRTVSGKPLVEMRQSGID